MQALGKTTLPERAVDTWVAAYLASEFSGVSLWAPTQRTQVDFDISVERDGKLFVLEQKAPVYGLREGDHRLQVDVGSKDGIGQLWRYCTDARLVGLVWYVLPVPPYEATLAVGRGSSLMPEIARARVGGHRWKPGKPCEDWFYMVPAQDLYGWLRGRPGRRMPPLPAIGEEQPDGLVDTRSFPCVDVKTGPRNVMTLRQWAASVKECAVQGGLVNDGRIVHAGRLTRDGELVAEGRKVNIPLDESSEGIDANGAAKPSRSPGSTRAVFIPRDDIPGWT
jgi:hypothetical protein